MFEFNALNPYLTTFIGLIPLIGAMAGAITAFFAFVLRQPLISRIVFLLVLVTYFFSSALYVLLTSRLEARPPVPPFLGLRILVVVLISVALWLAWQERKVIHLIGAFFVSLQSYPVELFTTTFFPAFFTVSQLGMVTCLLIYLRMIYSRARGTVSFLSMKDALDVLPDGLAITGLHGRMSVVTPSMDTVLRSLGLPSSTPVDELWLQLSSRGKLIAEGETSSILVDIPAAKDTNLTGSEHWLLTHSTIVIDTDLGGQESFQQIYATNVTEVVALTERLRHDTKRQRHTTVKLRSSLRSVARLEREVLLASSRAGLHDVLAQRISFIHRFMEDKTSDPQSLEKLRELLTHLSDRVVDEPKTDLEDAWEALVTTFNAMGFAIEVKGTPPDDQQVFIAFLRIVREGASNAIAHAGADSMSVTFSEGTQAWKLRMSNGGTVPHGYTEGNGLRGMRLRAQRLGGHVDVSLDALFTVEVTIPFEARAQSVPPSEIEISSVLDVAKP